MKALPLLVVLLLAPVPTPKTNPMKPTSPAIIGSWRMTWNGSSGDVVFSTDGGYWCLWAGQQYIGSWKLEGTTLHVTEGRVAESPDSPPGSPLSWSVRFVSPALTGKGDYQGREFPFELRKP